MKNDKYIFFESIHSAFNDRQFVKLILHKKARKSQELQKIIIKPVDIKAGHRLSFNSTFPTRDETHNYTIEEAFAKLKAHLGNDFLSADFETTDTNYQLLFSRKRVPKLIKKSKANASKKVNTSHDNKKKRLVDPSRPYLEKLGIAQKGAIIPSGQKKYRQIDKYIEILNGLFEDAKLKTPMHIVDMGSGKGYLTFALYDFLTEKVGTETEAALEMKGIELRPDLVKKTNAIAQQLKMSGLRFETLDIRNYDAGKMDVLIALHACDTATDDAIAKGILNNAKVIVVAPCCHKQIRKQMKPKNSLAPVLDYGILMERQAELITDGIRALMLQQHGYETKVFEFVSTEHTGKNLMITAVKKGKTKDLSTEIEKLKTDFGIEFHYLEKALEA